MSAFTGRTWWGWGFLPLQFQPGENAETLGLTGEEIFEITGLKTMLDGKFAGGKTILVKTEKWYGRDAGLFGDGADRHATGNFVLPAWRHPAVCAEANWPARLENQGRGESALRAPGFETLD